MKDKTKKQILMPLINKPKTITEISKEIHKDRNNVGRFLGQMKDLVIEEERIDDRGKTKLVKLRKKAYRYLGVPIPKLSPKSKKKNKIKESRFTEGFINENDFIGDEYGNEY